MTILYESDWAKYPNAIVDTKTKNKSFLEFASLLKKMGVKNNLFHLSLLQPHLQGVDPFDPNLSEELAADILLECEYNFWYYLREICLLPATSGGGGNHVRANRGVICEAWVILNNIDLFHMQPRQTGKSAGADAITQWLQNFRCEGSLHFLVTKDNGLLSKNIKRLKDMRDLLPSYCYIRMSKDKDNDLYMNYAFRGNEVMGKGGQKDPASAEKIGRGHSFATAHNDEQPFCPYVHVYFPAMTSGMDAARKEAISKGNPNFMLTTTTAGDLTKKEGRYSFDYYNQGAPWTEKMYDCRDRDDLISVIKANRRGKALLISACFTHRMLGITDEEFYELITKVPSTPDQIDRDYFLVWTSGGQYSVIPTHILESMQRVEREPNYFEITETGYIIKWYVDEEEIEDVMHTQDIIISADTSSQIGQDATGFILRSAQSLATLATLRISESNIVITCEWLAKFMIKYPRTTLIMERASTASTFFDTLILVFLKYNVNPFKRIFNQVVQEPEKYKELNRHLVSNGKITEEIVNTHRRVFGFIQTGNTRNFLYSTVLQTAARQAQHVVFDKTLSAELRGLVMKDGRVDHTAEGHDDMVMAWLLSHWFVLFGINLGYYGIDTRKVMLNVSDEGKQFDESDLFDNHEIDRIQDEIEQLTNELRRIKHAGYQSMILADIERLNQELESYGVTSKNIDNIVEDVKENNYYRPRSPSRLTHF